MPEIVKCAKCDEVLYSGHDIVSPDYVIEMFDGKCPKCGRSLSFTPQKVEVHPYEPEKPEPEPQPKRKEPSGWFSKILRQIV